MTTPERPHENRSTRLLSHPRRHRRERFRHGLGRSGRKGIPGDPPGDAQHPFRSPGAAPPGTPVGAPAVQAVSGGGAGGAPRSGVRAHAPAVRGRRALRGRDAVCGALPFSRGAGAAAPSHERSHRPAPGRKPDHPAALGTVRGSALRGRGLRRRGACTGAGEGRLLLRRREPRARPASPRLFSRRGGASAREPGGARERRGRVPSQQRIRPLHMALCQPRLSLRADRHRAHRREPAPGGGLRGPRRERLAALPRRSPELPASGGRPHGGRLCGARRRPSGKARRKARGFGPPLRGAAARTRGARSGTRARALPRGDEAGAGRGCGEPLSVAAGGHRGFRPGRGLEERDRAARDAGAGHPRRDARPWRFAASLPPSTRSPSR